MSFTQFWYLLLLRRGLHYDKQSERGKAIILHLTKEGLCESRCDVGGDGFYLATEQGRAKPQMLVWGVIIGIATIVGAVGGFSAIVSLFR